ncbi:MAG: FkbM family methyltransferase [Halarcobacter sp.]
MDKNFNKLIKARNGYCLFNKNDKYIGYSLEKYGEFSHLEVELFKQICKKGDTIIEVGANIGAHTQFFSNRVGHSGKILAFEPQRIVFQTLCANISINSMTNVYTYHMALSNEEGTALIAPIDYTKLGNFGGISIENSRKGESVQQKTLDDFIEQVDNLKLIKVDVEGMEEKVLKGAKKIIKKYKPFLYVENDRQEKSQSLIEYIKSLDYELYWHMPKLYNPNNFYKSSENIFGNIVSVNMICIHKSLKVNVEKMIKIEDSKFHPMKKGKKENSNKKNSGETNE